MTRPDASDAAGSDTAGSDAVASGSDAVATDASDPHALADASSSADAPGSAPASIAGPGHEAPAADAPGSAPASIDGPGHESADAPGSAPASDPGHDAATANPDATSDAPAAPEAASGSDLRPDNRDNAWAAAAEAAASALPPEAELPPLPESFDELALPDELRRAIAKLGWTKPSPVQALSFEPLISGRDVMVQSHTGSGKTGAFCVPWLASRFDPRPASESGVQLLVLLPTRELAKQVCDELRRLASETPVEVLPVYGGTPMNPQLTSLRAGVHAVVGTPGRILDHIRRRSLDLSKVRTVVLDECDEMLSMGFLEDIRAILDQVKGEHLTALFSATIPSDIERIAKRYMKDPVAVQLSGDQVAAAEIEHAYYSVTSSIKTRDLLDVIMVEDPARAIIFCNTREETKLVASVLRREGFHAEELSSDLNQTQRERVMKLMREHKLRFLVATDVAARGIDISHVTHVINYSFPESAEVYVHRTGRTGRAGRTGVALSLINPREIGNFYYLKLQYSSIVFTERHLPPAEQLAAERTEYKLDGISKRFPELVSPEWVLLARSLMGDPRGERVIALLLERAMRAAPRPESVLDAPEGEAAEETPSTPGAPGEIIEREQRDLREGRERSEPRESRGDRDGFRGRGPRDRGSRDFGDRPRRDDGPRNFRSDRGDRPDRPDRGDAPRERPADEERGFRAERDRPEGERVPRAERPEGERNFRNRGDRPEVPRERPADDERGFQAGRDRPEGERPARAERPEGDRNFRGPRNDAPRERPADEERGFRAERDRPHDGPRHEGDRNRRDRFRDRDGRRRDHDARGPRDGEPRPNDPARANDRPNDRPNDARPDDRGERRRRRDRGGPESTQLPLQATGVTHGEAARLDPPTPVLAEVVPAEAAPAPAAVLATATPASESPALTAVATGFPPPGQIRLGRRGRLGDRGRFVQRDPAGADETIAAPTAEVTVIAATGDASPVPGDSVADLEGGDARRKRRRRRRRGRRGEGETGTDGAVTDASAETSPETDDADDDSDADGEAEAGPQTDAGEPAGTSEPGGDARRKRRRRRRGGARPPESDLAPRPTAAPVRPPEPALPPAPVGVPVAVPRRVAQDEIIIDIDESELEVVQSEFGQMDDEFDEFALLDRRQAVIETLQEEVEVELEDLTRSDATRTAAAAEAEEDDDSDEADEVADEAAAPDATDLSEEPGESTAAPDGDSDDDARKKRRRRRRKKAAPVVMPELTAPPHKDFWEVWATKFTYQDFEDGKYTPPNDVPEVEDPPPPAPVPVDRSAARQAPPRHGQAQGPSRHGGPRTSPPRSAPPPARPPVIAAAGNEADDAEFTKVCLNLGRSHGHKAATIRGLLRDHLGLEGRAIRDLTVRDADTLFRVHIGEVPRIQEALTQIREGEVQLAIEPANDDNADELRAPPPDALPVLTESLAQALLTGPDEPTPPEPEADAPVAATEATAVADDSGT